MRAPEVACDVQNCVHWLPGNLCSAGVIEVYDARGPQDATATGHTACRTFRYRRGLGDVVPSLNNVNWTGLLGAPFARGTQISPEVRCQVTSCLYWRRGERCGAEWIQVSGPAATAADETDCATFLPR